MPTITATDPPPPAADAPLPRRPPRRPPRRSGGALAVGAVIALFLLSFGVPRLIAGIAALDARPVLQAGRAGYAPDVSAATAAAAALQRAEAWVTEGEAAADRGYLLLLAATAADDDAVRRRLTDEAEAATVAGLASAPGAPGPWSRLAHMRRNRGDDAGAVAALRLSLLSGATAPALTQSRLTLAAALLPVLDPETTALLERQLRIGWVLAPDYISTWARQSPQAAEMTARALALLSDDEAEQFIRFHGRR